MISDLLSHVWACERGEPCTVCKTLCFLADFESTMNDLYFQARRTFPPLPSCTALGIYIDEELIRILIYCLFPHILVHLGPCLGKHFSTVGIFGLFPSKAWASMSFLGSTPMCTGLCWYLALCIAPKPKRTGAGWSHQIDGIEGNKKKGSFSASHHFRNVLKKNGRSRVKIHSVLTDEWYQKLFAEMLSRAPFKKPLIWWKARAHEALAIAIGTPKKLPDSIASHHLSDPRSQQMLRKKPWKIDIKWKFGSDEFPFQLGGFLGSSPSFCEKVRHFQPFWIHFWGIFPRINFLHLLNDINTLVAAQVDQKASTRYAHIWHTTKRNQKPKYESQITQIMQQKSVTAPPEKHLMYILAQTWWMAIESIFVTVNLPDHPPNVPPSETRVYLIRP